MEWFDHMPDALTAEAMAAKEGLKLVLENSYDKLILEVDSREGMRSSVGGVCFDITELGRSFCEFKIVWVCREANSVANCCASMVSATERATFWLDYIPEWLLGIAAIYCTPVIEALYCSQKKTLLVTVYTTHKVGFNQVFFRVLWGRNNCIRALNCRREAGHKLLSC
jgi:hypothetical protein